MSPKPVRRVGALGTFDPPPPPGGSDRPKVTFRPLDRRLAVVAGDAEQHDVRDVEISSAVPSFLDMVGDQAARRMAAIAHAVWVLANIAASLLHGPGELPPLRREVERIGHLLRRGSARRYRSDATANRLEPAHDYRGRNTKPATVGQRVYIASHKAADPKI